MSGADGWEDLSGVPEAVRQRVLALSADALGQVGNLPAALRQVAGFTPSRRARLGARALAEALVDDDLRERVSVQVLARLGAEPARGHDLTTVAALAWLQRGEGWQEALTQAVDEMPAAAPRDRQPEVDRLTERVEKLTDDARRQRTEHKERLAELKAEISDLRRKVGEARSAARSATEQADDLAARATEEAREATARATRAESELRRVRTEVEELREAARAVRTDARSSRDDANLRARLLLDTVLEAAAGLRRELGLPNAVGSPADRVAAAITAQEPQTAAGDRISTASRLEQSLGRPRVHLVVDGYNVTRSVWETTSLESQRTRLLSLLPALAARTRAEVTVVFDAAAVAQRPTVSVPRGVRVIFSPHGVIADDVIRDLVAAEPLGRPLVVVSDDQAVARDVRAAGASPASASALLNLLARDLRS